MTEEKEEVRDDEVDFLSPVLLVEEEGLDEAREAEREERRLGAELLLLVVVDLGAMLVSVSGAVVLRTKSRDAGGESKRKRRFIEH